MHVVNPGKSVIKKVKRFFCVACHRETVDRFEFDVRASDSGREESLSATARVRITVTDTNDHTPTFDAFPFRINISTASPPRFVIDILLAFSWRK